MRVVVALALLAGCDDLFNLEPIKRVDAAAVDTRIDTQLIDAFDPELHCRSDYTLEWWPQSRFRIYASNVAAWDANDACNGDVVGATHLATAQTREKLDVLIARLQTQGDSHWWMGAVQPVSATSPFDKWLWVTGEPVDTSLWDSATEPNDADGLETGHQEQFVIIEMARPGLIDIDGSFQYRALCECDGRPVTEDAKAAINQSRP